MYKDLFEKNIRRVSTVWETISTHLNSENIMKNAKQCAKKWSNLLRSYRLITKNNKQSGRSGVVKFKYFDRMQEILGNRIVHKVTGINIGIASDQIENDDEDADVEEVCGDENVAPTVNTSNLPAGQVTNPTDNLHNLSGISTDSSFPVGEKSKRRRCPTAKTQYYKFKKIYLEKRMKSLEEDDERKKKDDERKERDILSKIEFRKKKLEILEKLVLREY